MITKEEIGRRIKKVREQQHLTLKNVEARAGISATHISEIERGKTSPTIGALVRIAEALGRDPAYFIEHEELEDVSFVALEDRSQRKLERAAGEYDVLTRSIPSGKIDARLVNLAPNTSGVMNTHSHDADESVLVLSGSVRFKVDNEEFLLGEGDSIYYVAKQEHGYSNAAADAPARIIWFASERGLD